MAGRNKVSGEIMTSAEMIETARKERSPKIYKQESMEINDEAISQVVRRGLAEIENADKANKINLSNVEMVKEVSKQYLKACADSATFPTISGLARAMGVTRRALYYWMQKTDTETGQWLMVFHDLCSDVLAELALKNNVHPVVGIFIEKAMFGLSETDNIVINARTAEDDYTEGTTNYKQKYLDIIGQ